MQVKFLKIEVLSERISMDPAGCPSTEVPIDMATDHSRVPIFTPHL